MNIICFLIGHNWQHTISHGGFYSDRYGRIRRREYTEFWCKRCGIKNEFDVSPSTLPEILKDIGLRVKDWWVRRHRNDVNELPF